MTARRAAFGRRTAAVVVLAAAAGVLLQLVGPVAQAETPQQRAAALAAQVHTLQARAEQDAEAYDAAESRLGQVTAEQFQAEQALTAAQSAEASTAATGDAAVRQLYELGGPAVLYTSALAGGGDLASVQGRMVAARGILANDRAAAAASSAHSATALAAQRHADALAGQQSQLDAQVAAQAQAVQQTLAATQTLLASADAQVTALAQADEARREAADNAAFLQQQTLAQAGIGPYAAQLTDPPPASSPAAATALAAAEALAGHPYLWGGTGPVGYDCSGTTQAAYAAAGIHLPRTAAEQYGAGPHVPLADLAPGDLLFWATNPADPATIEHVAIYAGDGLMVSADHTGDVVRLQPVWWDGYAGATRPAAQTA